MPFIPVPNGIQLCFDFVTAGQNWQFCLMLKKSAGAPTPTDLAAVSAMGASWWNATAKPYFTTNTVLKDARATDVTAQGAPQSISVSNVSGSDSPPTLPMNAALVISLRTAKRGRSYRGRAYISGIPTAQADSAVIADPTYTAGLVGTFGTLQTTLDAAGFDIVVASRRHNGVTTNPAETNEVIAFIGDLNFDSQRRRLAGRGT